MNRTFCLGAKLQINLDPTKGVNLFGQQERGHGSRNRLRKV